MKKNQHTVAVPVLLSALFMLSLISVTAQDWHIAGNSGTTTGTNFIGTTDAKALMFKVNSQRSAFIDFNAAKGNTSFGFQALNNPAGIGNAVFGYKASLSNTTGNYNISMGAYALFFNTTGYSNVAVGLAALYKSVNKNNTVAIGDSALYNNGSGAGFSFQAAGNTAVGSKSLYTNTTGYSNTAAGFRTLYFNTTGYENTANGYQALYSNTTGASNTATGYLALYSNTAGFYNTAYGKQALQTNNTGGNNTALGYQAMNSNTTGGDNTAMGVGALYSNTTGSYNIAIGKYAMRSSVTGYNNIAIGPNAMFSNTTGYSNTTVGYYALNSNTTGTFNTSMGNEAMRRNSSGENNTAVGSSALFTNTTGSENTALGANALLKNITGSQNVAIGDGALFNNTTGVLNTAVGSGALGNMDVGNYNTFIGGRMNGIQLTADNTTGVGFDAIRGNDNEIRIGNTSVTSIGGQVGWTNYSDERIKENIRENVPGLQFIQLLKPVTYRFSLAKEHNLLDKKNDTLNWRGKYDIEKNIYSGFLAQQVDKAAKSIGYDFSGVDRGGVMWGLRYAEFVVPLVKAVQELDENQKSQVKNQNDAVAALQIENEELKKEVDELKKMMQTLQQSFNNCNPCQQSSVINEQLQTRNGKPETVLLEQNIPNPFSNTTTINYILPQQYSNAKIIVVDKSGKVLKEINVSGSGKGSINFSAPFGAGASYHYSLYVDGKLIDTKQMILTK